MARNDITAISFAQVYPLYVQKVERKGRTAEELDEVLRWLTGYSDEQIHAQVKADATLGSFINEAPALNPARSLITGVICGMRVQDIEDDMTREIRYMDKVVDELAKGKAVEKIQRMG